jgi:hypothetical protein
MLAAFFALVLLLAVLIVLVALWSAPVVRSVELDWSGEGMYSPPTKAVRVTRRYRCGCQAHATYYGGRLGQFGMMPQFCPLHQAPIRADQWRGS